MCGIAGVIAKNCIEYETLNKMVLSIQHRGPDETGFYIKGNVGLGHSRLSIMDPQNGKQPIKNEDDSIVVIFNGEIYNHLMLRIELIKRGHTFLSNSDSAILPHMYEEYGLDMFEKLNGQFAIAIWSELEARLILARDRLGEKPLYYFHHNDTLCFASEAKAIFKSGFINPSISPVALKQVFTYWTTLNYYSIFDKVYQVPQGCFLVFGGSQISVQKYWKLEYNGKSKKSKSMNEYIDELDYKLASSVKARMMSDVPISFYLSGGLDSSLVTSIASRHTNQRINTFSIVFDDTEYDESEYQDYMSQYLGTNHQKVLFSSRQFPALISDVIYHTEVPLLRSGAFPMYVLAQLVRRNNTKVVLSGEGSDELFGGYDIFREVKIREFCQRNPGSKFRPLLFKKVNNFVKGLDNQPANSLSLYYNTPDILSCYSSHCSRWKLGIYCQQFFSQEYREQMNKYNENELLEELLPQDFSTLTPIQRAQYLEIMTLFSNYLLSSQGDRVSMASSVECRYPFLDYDIVEFANSLPDDVKIKVLEEKYIVKRLAQKYIPEKITKRKKFPYRAPVLIPELLKNEYIREILCFSKLKQYGIFNPYSTEKLLFSIVGKKNPNERDFMLFLGILTTQILYDRFIR